MKQFVWLFLVWTSAAHAQAASNDALTTIDNARRNDARHGQIVAAEQAVQQENWALAVSAWQKLAISGVESAPAQLCRLYFDARTGSFEEATVSDWCRRAAGIGDADGLYRMGLLYLIGLGVPKNPDQAYAFCAAAQLRNVQVPAKFCLASIAEDQARAASATLADSRNRGALVSPAANPTAPAGSSPRVMCDRAFVAIGTVFDPVAVTQWCGKAAQAGDPSALQRMGLMHLTGLGGPRDLDLAERDCLSAKQRGEGHVSAAFCLAAIAEMRRSLDAAAQGRGPAIDQAATGRPLPNTLPDPFAIDRALDAPHRTAGGLDYTCRKMAEWARFEAPGMVILKPRDKLFGKPILDFKSRDYDELDGAALACADAAATTGGDYSLRRDLAAFRSSMTDLRTRQASLQTQNLQARAEADQLARDQLQAVRDQQIRMSEVRIDASLATPQEQACAEAIRRGVTGSLLGEQTTLEIRNSNRSDDNGNFVVHGEARLIQSAGNMRQTRDFEPFTCAFIGRTEKIANAVLLPPPPGFNSSR
jgi:TPR repeat protein